MNLPLTRSDGKNIPPKPVARSRLSLKKNHVETDSIVDKASNKAEGNVQSTFHGPNDAIRDVVKK